MNGVPVGWQSFKVTYMGYEDIEIPNVVVLSGKETVLDIELTESAINLEEAKVVAARKGRDQPLNSMAIISARQFTVEETRRYAGSLFDPARMASSFAGVASLDGESNEIVIRGNSPRGVLWRLEGIEIPNPNHFRDGEGASGGGVAIITSDVMSNSDFFTGAFPAEYGNALSGAFDIKMRKGNAGKREYSFQVGILGAQASIEGPFKKGGQSSYLINYRAADLSLLEKMGITIGDNDIQPAFNDIAINLNFMTKNAGYISLFGLGGISSAGDVAIEDTSAWVYWSDKYDEKEYHRTGIIGLKHFYPLKNQKTYIKTVLMSSDEYNSVVADTLDNFYIKGYIQNDVFQYPTFRASTLLNHKFNARNTLRSGIIFSKLWFDILSERMNWEEKRYERIIDDEGTSFSIQAYSQWQHRLNTKLDINSGFHIIYFGLNKSYSIEPRFSVKWKFLPGQSLSYGAGLHSKIEALSVYFTEVPSFQDSTLVTNKNLGLTRALHNVVGYDVVLNENLRMKIEGYYQYLFHVAQPIDPESKLSGVNFLNGIVDIELNNGGEAYNYGIELTLERFYSNNFYYLFTSSLYESKYKAPDGKIYNSLFNGNYIFNILGGKEFVFKNSSSLALNAKFIFKGGNRMTPIDEKRSIEEGDPVYQESKYLEDKIKDYIRLDFSTTYRKNYNHFTWELSVDIQNITNRKNIYRIYWDGERNEISNYYFPGILPNINFRVVF